MIAAPVATGGIPSETEEQVLEAWNDWVEAQGLPQGQTPYECTDIYSGEQRAVFDLAWPNGIQEDLSQPVAVLLNEGAETLELASAAGFRCFTNVEGSRLTLPRKCSGRLWRREQDPTRIRSRREAALTTEFKLSSQRIYLHWPELRLSIPSDSAVADPTPGARMETRQIEP